MRAALFLRVNAVGLNMGFYRVPERARAEWTQGRILVGILGGEAITGEALDGVGEPAIGESRKEGATRKLGLVVRLLTERKQHRVAH